MRLACSRAPRRLRDISGAGYLAPPTKNPGDALTSPLWNTYVRDNLDFGMVRPIADVTLAAPAASIDLTSIPATFAHLMLLAYLRGDTGGGSTTGAMRFNNDSAANYDYIVTLANGSTLAAGETFGTTFVHLGEVPAVGAGGNLFSVHVIKIPMYLGANNKLAWVSAGAKTGTSATNLFCRTQAGFWRANTAINRLTIFPTAGNFIAGSRLTLYGMGGI